MDSLLVGDLPFASRVFRYEDLSGTSYALLVSKGTWDLRTGRMCTVTASADAVAEVRDTPLYVAMGDLSLDATQREALGPRLATTILLRDHDQVPPKLRFDVVVDGYAHAPGGKPQPWFDAGIRVGAALATVRAYGPRIVQKKMLSSVVSAPLAPVRCVPLGPAFTGWGRALNTPASLLGAARAQVLSPWIEAVGVKASASGDASACVSLGTWSEDAPHRLRWAGTYDDRWRRERAPQLPADFNGGFYNTADPALQLDGTPAPGTPIRLANLSEVGLQDTVFPAMSLDVSACYDSGIPRHQRFALRPDTLLLQPDLQRMAIVWRALVPLRHESLRRLELRCTGSAR